MQTSIQAWVCKEARYAPAAQLIVNGDSLLRLQVMAMLEAFLHDPLINWRLLNSDEDDASTVADAPGLEADQPVRVDRNVGSVIAQRRVAINAIAEDAVRDERLLNVQARKIIQRVETKLLGTDFPIEQQPMPFPEADDKGRVLTHEARRVTAPLHNNQMWSSQFVEESILDISTQVDRLITEAQSHANLVRLYTGWNPYW